MAELKCKGIKVVRVPNTLMIIYVYLHGMKFCFYPVVGDSV